MSATHPIQKNAFTRIPLRRSAAFLRRLSLLCLGLCGCAQAATHTWSGAGGNALWSNALNWSSGGAPAAGESGVVLIFPANATGFSPSPNFNLTVDRIEISDPAVTG